MVLIKIRCPSCSLEQRIEINYEIVNSSLQGITAINIQKNHICSHSFVIYVDKDLSMRDFLMTDFQVELPQMEKQSKVDKKIIPNLDTKDIDLIKTNIFAVSLINILRACLYNKKTLFLCDEIFLHSKMTKFFENIFNKSFKNNLSIELTEDYKKRKKDFKDYIVSDNNKIWNDKSKFLESKKNKIEKKIVQKFLAEHDPLVSLIILRNEIQNIFTLSREIIEIISNYDGEEKLGKVKIIDMLVETKIIKISFMYFEFLLDVVKSYFNFDLSVLPEYYYPAFGI